MDFGRKYFFGALLMMATITSCVKDPQDIPPGFTGEAVFGMQATLDNAAFNIEAGFDQWTDLPLTEVIDSVQTYKSIFSIDGCLDACSPSIAFTFFQSLPMTGDASQDFASTIRPGTKLFVQSGTELDSFAVSLMTHPALFMSGYSFWEDLTVPSNSFFPEWQTTVGYQQLIDVCFQSQVYTGCQYKQCVVFNPATEVPCLSRIEPKLENPRYLSLRVKPTGTAPFTVLWSNGSAAQTIVIPLQDTVAEIYASVLVEDALGNRSQLAQMIRLQNDMVDACYFPIELSSELVVNGSIASRQNRVEIAYTDEDGVIWTTKDGIQKPDSKVVIEQVSYYGPSPSGQASFMVELTVDALLYDASSGLAKEFKSERLTLALSHD